MVFAVVETGPFSERDLSKNASSSLKAKRPNSLNRIILPIEDTPSLVESDRSQLSVNTEISGLKSYLRIYGYYIDKVIEDALEIKFLPGGTRFQGAQAGQGYQSAHYHLAPGVTDNMAHQVIESVVAKGLTPTRSYPYLRHRASLASPDAKILQEKRGDRVFVEDFIVSRLPDRGLESSLSETAYEKSRNATFDGLTESNKFDSLLEAKIARELELLEDERKTKGVDAEYCVRKLVLWLNGFYNAAIENNKTYLLVIDEFFKVQSEMAQIEEKYGQGKYISDLEITTYIQHVVKFLDLKKQLSSPLEGVSRSVAFQRTRDDFPKLQTLPVLALIQDPLIRRKSVVDFLNGVKKQPEIDTASIRFKYQICQQEAAAQLEGIAIYNEPCAIAQLKTLIFGVVEEGERKPPTEEQLKAQILKIIEPERRNKELNIGLKRGSSNQEQENRINSKRRRLNEEEESGVKEKARRSLSFANEQL